jgi:cyclophilin family peptidyl-prolyl cis-trans isomerase
MSPLGSFNVPVARGAADQNMFRFGEVINGKSIIRKVEGLKTQSDDKPVHEVSIIGRLSPSSLADRI